MIATIPAVTRTRDSLTLTVPVADGKLVLSPAQQAAMDDMLRSRNGKTVALKLAKPTSTRSLEQNKFYWGQILTTIASETGHTTEEIHTAVKDMFLPRKFIKLGSREVEVRKTTTDLNPTEFTHYLEQVRAWAAQELGIQLPT